MVFEMEPLQFIDVAFKWVHSVIRFTQDCKDLAKKQEFILEKTKLLLDKAQKYCKKQVNAKKRKWRMK